MFSSSSSLAVSEHDLPRHKGSSLLKNSLFRKSKQQMVEKKMFGSRKGMHGKDFKFGRKFREKKGSGSTRFGKFIEHDKPMTSKGISPSVDEFDHMMESVTHNPSKKRSMFSRKQFG